MYEPSPFLYYNNYYYTDHIGLNMFILLGVKLMMYQIIYNMI